MVVALAIIGVGGWIGSEWHYRGCVEAAEASNPVRYVEATGQYGDSVGGYELGQVPPAGTPAHFEGRAARARAVSDCSRWP